MRKRILSIWLSVCMVLTMLPISAMAVEADIPAGTSGEIIAFAPLAETEKSVPTGIPIEDLGLPESLTATVRTAVTAGIGTSGEPVQDSGNPDNLTEATPGSATPTGSGEQAKADKTTEPEWSITTSDIPVTWTSEYDMHTEGVYVFTPVIEGYTVSSVLPEITVTVGEMLPIAAARSLIAPQSTTYYNIWLSNVQVTDANKDNITGGRITAGTVSYNSDTNTLILKDVTIGHAYFPGDNTYSIYAEQDLKIVLEGTNRVTGESYNNNKSIGIYNATGELDISGDGSLNVSSEPGSISYGIYAKGNLTISSGTITATSASSSGTSSAICSEGTVTISGGEVTATGGAGESITGGMGGTGGAGIRGNVTVMGTATLTCTGGAGGSITGGMGSCGDGGAGISGDITVMGTATLASTGGKGGSSSSSAAGGDGGNGVSGSVTVKEAARLTATGGGVGAGGLMDGMVVGVGISGTITVGDGYTIVAGSDANHAEALIVTTKTSKQYVAITPPAPQAQWGVAESGGGAPTSWVNSGTLADAMTYANNLESGKAYIQLQSDVNLSTALVFESGKTTILDLNGKEINRGLTTAIENGNVINISGSLTLCDSSTDIVANQGRITGGFSSMANSSIPYNGGGVGVNKDASFTMQGGNITGNKTTSGGGGGGGVYVGANCSFMMTGGSIANNEAKNWGGGVYVAANGSFTMLGGSITNNRSLNGGVYWGAPFTVGGTAVIDDNQTTDATPIECNAMRYNYPISVHSTTPLTSGAFIGVTAYKAPTGGGAVNVTGANSADYSSYFRSDNSGYMIRNGTGSTVQLVVRAPVIGTLTISDTFTAGHNLTLSDLNSKYKPSITDNGVAITEQGWQTSVDSGSWTDDWPLAGHVRTLNPTSTYKLRYYVTYNDGATLISSNEVTLSLVGHTTALALEVSPESPQNTGASITLTATLSGSYAFDPLDGQSITFKNGTATLGTASLNSGGVASYTWTPSAADIYSLTAEYAATAYNKAATSSAVSYTVIVDPNIAAVAAAKTALVDGSVNVAFGASQDDKTAAVQAYVDGLLTGDAAGVTANVIYNSETNKYDVSISKGSVNDTKSLSMTVNIAPDPDIAIVAGAKTDAQGASYSNMTQVAVTDEETIKAALKNTAVTAVNNSDITITINNVAYTTPIAGTSANPSGTNGSYTFTVTVSKGSQSETTEQKTITITATAYTGITDAQAVSAAKTALIDGSANVAFGASQDDKTAAVQAYVNGLLTGDATGVTAIVTYNNGTEKYDVAISKGSVNDTKSLSMTVNVALDPDIATIAGAKTAAQGASYANMTQAAITDENAIETALKNTAVTAVNSSDITITINKDSYTPPIAGTSASPGGTNGSYTFTVTVSKGTQSETTGQKTITITATPYTGGTGGGSSNGGGSTTPPSTKPTEPVTGSTENKATVDNKGNASVSLTDKNITDAIADAKAEAAKKGVNAGDITAVIHVTTGGKNADTVTVNLPKTTQEQVIGNKIASVQLVIDRPDLTIGIDLAAVTEINRQAKADVQLSATRMGNTKLSGDAKAAIGNRPAYDLNALYGSGKSVTDFGKGSVSVEIPYTLQKGEIAGNVYAVYVDAKGKVTYLTDSSYDAKRGTVVFSTSHFSTYGVAYKASSQFADIDGHWAKDDILFVANRGLMTGTSTTTFSPNGSMTRGMFVTALGRLASADISAYKQSNFTDVKADAYYMGYIEWGVKNNILVGIGGGKFDPDGLVTREQMSVIMDRYATAIGFKLPEVHTQNVFADNAKIGAWATPSVKRIQMAGIIQGKNNNIYDPQGTATRAEVSAVLRRFVELAIFSDTAQGWTMNDSGKWMYYENGQPVTGKRDIDGATYTFDQYGVTSDVPKNLRYTTYTVQKGDSFWLIAHKLGCTMSELERLNNKSRFSLILPGDVLRVPEK